MATHSEDRRGARMTDTLPDSQSGVRPTGRGGGVGGVGGMGEGGGGGGEERIRRSLGVALCGFSANSQNRNNTKIDDTLLD